MIWIRGSIGLLACPIPEVQPGFAFPIKGWPDASTNAFSRSSACFAWWYCSARIFLANLDQSVNMPTAQNALPRFFFRVECVLSSGG